MVIRPNQHWFFRLFDWHGSVLSKIIFRLCLNIAMSIIAILVYQWYELLGIHLTVAPFSLLGIAIAIFLGFRNNASYSRLVEARTLWGNMLITHRNILRNIKALLPEDKQFNRDFSNLLIAFSWSLKHELRKTNPMVDLYRLLPRPLFDEIMNSPYPTKAMPIYLPSFPQALAPVRIRLLGFSFDATQPIHWFSDNPCGSSPNPFAGVAPAICSAKIFLPLVC